MVGMKEPYPRLVQMTSLGSGAASASQAVLSWCSMEFDATACETARLAYLAIAGKCLPLMTANRNPQDFISQPLNT